MLTEFHIPSAIIVGGGAINRVAIEAERLALKRTLIVCGNYARKSGLADQVGVLLQEKGIASNIFPHVQPDPTDQNVMAGLDRFRETNSDGVIAIGGGSPIDAAKIISLLATNDPPLQQYAGQARFSKTGIALIAIPTTAGSGSEVSQSAIIIDTDRKEKMVLLDPKLLPSVALVDYELTSTMPPSLTAYTGMDALYHGIEAYVSRRANPLTDPLAISCIGLTAKNLLKAFEHPENKTARQNMMTASCQAGMVSTNSSMTLIHGMARPLGAWNHIPHGLSNALLAPAVIEFSIPGAIKRYAVIGRTMGFASESDTDDTSAHALVTGLLNLNTRLNIPRLRNCLQVDFGTFKQNLEKMAVNALASGSPQNNPVGADIEQIVKLYQTAW